MDAKKISLYAGLTVVVGTHLYMLAKPMDKDMQVGHAVINLVAAGMIGYAVV